MAEDHRFRLRPDRASRRHGGRYRAGHRDPDRPGLRRRRQPGQRPLVAPGYRRRGRSGRRSAADHWPRCPADHAVCPPRQSAPRRPVSTPARHGRPEASTGGAGHGRSRTLVLHLLGGRPALRLGRRQPERSAAGKPDQQRSGRHAALTAAQPDARRRAEQRPGLRRCRPVRSRPAVLLDQARRPAADRCRRAHGPRPAAPLGRRQPPGRRLRRQGRRAGGAGSLWRTGRKPDDRHPRYSRLVPPGTVGHAGSGQERAGRVRRTAPQGAARGGDQGPHGRLRAVPRQGTSEEGAQGHGQAPAPALAVPAGAARLRLCRRCRCFRRAPAPGGEGGRQGTDQRRLAVRRLHR